jgi:hypothetical protein
MRKGSFICEVEAYLNAVLSSSFFSPGILLHDDEVMITKERDEWMINKDKNGL